MSDKILGLAEMAEHFGVTKQVISNWRKRGRLPEPAVQLALGPVWYYHQILYHRYDPITKKLTTDGVVDLSGAERRIGQMLFGRRG